MHLYVFKRIFDFFVKRHGYPRSINQFANGSRSFKKVKIQSDKVTFPTYNCALRKMFKIGGAYEANRCVCRVSSRRAIDRGIFPSYIGSTSARAAPASRSRGAGAARTTAVAAARPRPRPRRRRGRQRGGTATAASSSQAVTPRVACDRWVARTVRYVIDDNPRTRRCSESAGRARVTGAEVNIRGGYSVAGGSLGRSPSPGGSTPSSSASPSPDSISAIPPSRLARLSRSWCRSLAFLEGNTPR